MLLLIQPTPQNVGPSLTNVLEKYAWESSNSSLIDLNPSPTSESGSNNPTPGGMVGNQYLSEEVFLLMQSIGTYIEMYSNHDITNLDIVNFAI